MRGGDSRRRDPRLGEAEALARAGRLELARAVVEAIAGSPVSRADRAVAANLAWRAGRPDLGVSFLGPLVRATRRSPARADDREKAEYAACLVKLGAPDEAMELLSTLDARAVPVASLYLGFALVARWDYGAAVAPFAAYAESRGLDPYQRLVAELNVAASLVQERRLTEAEARLARVLDEARSPRDALVRSYALQLAGESALLGRDAIAARARLDEALALVDPASLYGFLARKLGAIASLMRSGGSRDSRRELDAIRREARRRSHWETLRDCDRYEAITTGNRALLLGLYFGTPFAPFRERLVREAPDGFVPPEVYLRRLGPRGRTRAVLDVAIAECDGRGLVCAGSVAHRALVALASDAYRPFTVASLFARIFAGQHWSPDTGPARVRQALRFLSRALDGSPFFVERAGGKIRLGARASAALRLRAAEPQADRIAPRLARLGDRLGGERFSAGRAASVLGCTRRQALRVLVEGIGRGAVERTGAGAQARYVLKLSGGSPRASGIGADDGPRPV